MQNLEGKRTDLQEELANKEVELDEMKTEQGELSEQLFASWKLVTELKEDLTKWEERERHDDMDRATLQRQLTKVISEKQQLERNMDVRHENVLAENMFLSDENTLLKNQMKNFEQRLLAVQQERAQDKELAYQNEDLMKENILVSEENKTLKNEINLLEHRLMGAQRDDGRRQELTLLTNECSTYKRALEQQENELKTVRDNLTQKTRELNWYREHNLQRAQEVLRAQQVNVTRHGQCFHFGECQAITDREYRQLEMCTFCAENLHEKHGIMLANRSQVWPRD